MISGDDGTGALMIGVLHEHVSSWGSGISILRGMDVDGGVSTPISIDTTDPGEAATSRNLGGGVCYLGGCAA